MMKVLNKILRISVYTIVSLSIIQIILLNWKLAANPDLKLSFSRSALEFYFDQYGSHIALFALCIAAIAAYSALNSLNESISANRDRIRQDRFTEWKNALELRVSQTEVRDPVIKRFFTEQRFLHFLILYRLDFNIRNVNELTEVFTVYGKFVNTIETQNDKHVNMGGVYRDAEHSYSFQSFKDVLFSGCMSIMIELK